MRKGVRTMGSKRVLISLPEALLSDIDALASRQGESRSFWIRGALYDKLKKQRIEAREKALEQGYRIMEQINRRLSEEGVIADNEQLLTYEHTLSESE